MQPTWEQIQKKAIAFSKRWKDGKDEMSQGQSFVRDFLAVFGIDDPDAVGRFEKRTPKDGSGLGRMDYFLPKVIAIEMKSKGKDLGEAYQQLKDYVIHLPDDEMPKLMMVSDFEIVLLVNRSTNQSKQFKTKDLHKHARHFATLAGFENIGEVIELHEVNVKAAEKMALLHKTLKDSGFEGHDLEVYLVRLMFCLFADSTGIFNHQTFLNYIQNSEPDGDDLPERITKLFDILNMPDEKREKRKLLSPTIKQFQYINGRIFEERIESPEFDKEMRQTLIDCCKFDWSKISPAIFGAMFQGVMDEKLRRELGAHYTSEDNILKLINPLFMDDLRKDFNKVKNKPKELAAFHEKIGRLKFLDPACGCGNFLIIAYRELRSLELEILRAELSLQKLQKGSRHSMLDIDAFLKVNVHQFYGIEIEAWPCQVAQTGLWLMDHLMNLKVSEECGEYYKRIPLKHNPTIVHANAHRIDWESVVPKSELNFILGNPPFRGARTMDEGGEQKEDMKLVFGELKGLGNLDYVTAWYKKAADMMNQTKINTAFVSTNSITQGEQVAILWKPLIEQGIFINFGIPTFKWSNEAKGKAAVYCVIVGFSYKKTVPNISPHLIEAPTVFIENRTTPISDAPLINYGSFALDDGNYTISENEYAEIINAEPLAKQFLRPFLGARELIHNEKRYCIWLLGANPSELDKCKIIKRKIENVKKWRAKSNRKNTLLLAETPTLFAEIRQPETSYLAIPTASSENRKYIPIDYLNPDVIASNQIYVVPNATLYHFGILTSSVHMAWMRAVCGRLEMRYRYSSKIVYNNFPWATASDKQKKEIEMMAQGVLDVRKNFPNSTLAVLYNTSTMPPELSKAHQNLDRAVMSLYGFTKDLDETAVVAKLMGMYQGLVESKR